MIATPLYAAALTLLFVVLGMRVVYLRRKLGVSLADEGNIMLRKAIRAHGNFAEYVPLALLLMYFVETRTQAGNVIHGMGLALMFGRILHAIGVSKVNEPFLLRVIGMICTFGVLVGAATMLLWFGSRAAMLM